MDQATLLFFVLIFSIIGMCGVAFFLLAKKLSKLKNNYIINKLSYIFMGFLLFIMLEGVCRVMDFLGKVGIVPVQYLPIANLISSLEIIPIAGLFFTSVFLVYFLFEANIDLLAKYEDNVSGFLRVYSILSKELELKNTKLDKHSKKE